MTTMQDSPFIVGQLIRVTAKEARYLERTADRLRALNIDLAWVELRELKNRLVHEYMASADDLLDALHQALQGVRILTDTQLRMAVYAQKMRWV